MLIKPPAPASRVPKRLTLTCSLGVHLRHAQAGHVEAAAVIEVELLVLVNDGIGIDRRAEIEPTLRQPADHPRLRRQRDVVQYFFLIRDLGHPFGHADAEVHYAAHRQLERAAAGDDLALVQRHRP